MVFQQDSLQFLITVTYRGIKAMGKFIDLTGQRFGRWVVVCKSKKRGYFDCICDCGTTRSVNAYTLSHGKTQSCGCYMKEQTSKATKTHGDSNTRLYRTWRSMLARCEIKSQTVYKHYGGRGIKVCAEWHDYQTFKNWATKSGYTDKLTLDRIDFNGNYEPSNCRWITMKKQANNTRANRNIVCDGISHTLAEWSEITKVNAETIGYRLNHGWDMHKALFTPARRAKNGNSSS